jgi:integrase
LRANADDARRTLASGIDPSAARIAQKNSLKTAAANTFEPLAREWFATHKSSWVAAHAAKNWQRIEKNLLPWLGKRPITEITAPELLAVLRRVESRGKLDTRTACDSSRARCSALPSLPGAQSGIPPKTCEAR